MDVRRGLEALDRYDMTHDVADLTVALRELNVAYMAFPVGDPGRSAVCDGLGRATRHEAERIDDAVLYDAAIRLLREAADCRGEDRFGYAYLTNLGRALADRYDRNGRPEDLAESERCYRAGLRLFPDRAEGRSTVLGGLVTVLQAKLDRIGDPDILREMVGYARQAVASSFEEPFPFRRAMAMNQLAALLNEQATRCGDRDLLVEALEWAERAAATFDVAPGDAAIYEHRVGVAAKQLGRLERAEAALRSSLARTPPGHAIRPSRQHDLADVCYRRFVATGDGTALNEAVALVIASTAATPRRHVEYAGRAAFLGNLLMARYRSIGGPSLVDQAIVAYRDATEAIQPHDTFRPMAWSVLGNGLMERALVTRDPADAEQCLAAMRTAAALSRQIGSHRAIVETNLAVALRNFVPDATPEVIGLMDRLLAEVRLTPYERVRVLHVLGRALATRGDARAVQVMREAAAIDPVATPALAEMVEPREAVALYRQVATADTSPPRVRVQACASSGELAADAGDWPAALAAYAQAVDNYRYLTPQLLNRADREHELSRFHGIAADAAACALHTGDPRRALELLEHGRARLLTQLLSTRGTLARLRIHDPDRADRLAQIAHVLDWQQADADSSALVNLIDVEQRRALQQEYETLLEPPPALSLEGLPSTVAVINVSRYRCDALLVSAGTITVLPLPGITSDELADRVLSFAAGDSGVLNWLWAAVVAPVLDAIGAREAVQPGQPWPRVWWCPTGLLTFLPLHAAGATLDRVVSSYTPSIAVLADALHSGMPNTAPTQLLVTLPQTPGYQDLPGAHAEAAHVPATTVLDGPRATRTALLREISTHTRVHFAGHAGQDPANPGTARLQAYDAAVPLTDLAQLNLTGAHLAFLNACQTATGQVTLADEAVHLAGALRTAGFPHVVATMWQVDDHLAAQVAKGFYTRLDSLGPAEALHHALRDARQATIAADPRDIGFTTAPSGLPTWAPYIHLGP